MFCLCTFNLVKFVMNKRSLNNSHGAPIWLNFGFSIYNVTVYWYLWFQFNTWFFIFNWVMSWLVIKLCSLSYLKTTIQFQWRQNHWRTLLLPLGRFVWKLFFSYKLWLHGYSTCVFLWVFLELLQMRFAPKPPRRRVPKPEVKTYV